MATTARSDAGSVRLGRRPGADGDIRAPLRQAVLERLHREGYRFDFYQVVRLLEKVYSDAPPPGETHVASRELVHVRPDTALAFPATDVRRVEANDEEGAVVLVTFMGLYGIGSPLPEFFYDVLATEQEHAAPLRAFMDIFNQRLYTAFYRAWKKYRPELRRLPDYRDTDSRRFLALGGLGTPGALADSPADAAAGAPMPRALLMAFAGRLLPRRRNVEGLEALLSAYLDLPVEVIENVARWVPIRDRPGVGRASEGGGSGMSLGRSAVIGQKVYDRMGKFRLRIGPMKRSQYLELLPQGALASTLQWLVRTYTTDYLDFDVELQLQTEDLAPARLGDTSSRLGWSTCLGTPSESVLSRVVQYASA